MSRFTSQELEYLQSQRLGRLAEMEREECQGQAVPKSKNPQKGRAIQKRGEEPMRQALYRMSGVDLTGIDAIGVETVQVVLSEYGPDLSRFPTEKQFVSHVTLAPHKPTSAGKPVKKKKRNSASTRVAAALRMASLIRRLPRFSKASVQSGLSRRAVSKQLRASPSLA